MKTEKIDADIVYAVDVIEHEAGWGSKPDGFCIAGSPDVFDKVRKTLSERGSYEYFCTLGDRVERIILSEEGKKRVSSIDSDHSFIDKYSEIGKLL